MVDLKDVLATNLRRLRHERTWTQEEVADRVGLSSRYIGSIERGRTSASITVVGRLAVAFGVDPCELLKLR